MVVDLPPGTGDTQLTTLQQVPVAGAVIVTTPEEVALDDARKGLRMFGATRRRARHRREHDAFGCPDCGSTHDIFGAAAAASSPTRRRCRSSARFRSTPKSEKAVPRRTARARRGQRRWRIVPRHRRPHRQHAGLIHRKRQSDSQRARPNVAGCAKKSVFRRDKRLTRTYAPWPPFLRVM